MPYNTLGIHSIVDGDQEKVCHKNTESFQDS